ncbi:MAG: hypothetical protein AAGA60_31795 [Cyanobacteria bacterium P01_E01_bin.42]
MKTIQNIEQSLDDIENAERQQEKTFESIEVSAAIIYSTYDEAKTNAIQQLEELFLDLLTQEIDRDDLKTLGYKGLGSRGVDLCLIDGIFVYQDVRVRVAFDWKRIGEFWLIGLDSESVRRCDKGELMETLLQTFAQIRLNEKAAIGDGVVE